VVVRFDHSHARDINNYRCLFAKINANITALHLQEAGSIIGKVSVRLTTVP